MEVCLGLGAHTHYFDRDQTTVAWMIDYLIRGRPIGDAEGPSDLEAPGAPPAGPVVTLAASAGQPAQVVDVDASVVADGAPAPAAAPDATP